VCFYKNKAEVLVKKSKYIKQEMGSIQSLCGKIFLEC